MEEYTEFDRKANHVIKELEKLFIARGISEHVSSRYDKENRQYDVVITGTVGYTHYIAEMFSITKLTYNLYYDCIEQLKELCLRKHINTHQVVYKKCPVDHMGCTVNKQCVMCEYYNQNLESDKEDYWK